MFLNIYNKYPPQLAFLLSLTGMTADVDLLLCSICLSCFGIPVD